MGKNFVAIFCLLFSLLSAGCENANRKNLSYNDVECSLFGCSGSYEGLEFVGGSDVAHQFSNTMSTAVGDQLKLLYEQGDYSQVDFAKIEMETTGMGSGTVVYSLSIPFALVDEACDAYTSFDHVGGWNHSPALEERKQQLNGALMEGHSLYISELKRTKEGLQEYWIQWKNQEIQQDCK